MQRTKKLSWLKPNEVYALLKFYTQSSVPIISAYKSLPESGDVFLIKKSEFKRWKQDGHSYVTRKNGTGVREDREKYCFESEMIQCTYVHGSGKCQSCKKPYLAMCYDCSLPITSILFHRRAYWLLSSPDIILVHYLNDSTKYMEIDSETSSLSGQTATEDQIKQLEDVLKQLDFEKTTPVQITDFSPEWADVHGGTKVLICTDPLLIVPNPRNLRCMFGALSVDIDSVQLGVFKCFTPSHSPGVVDLYITYENNEITLSRKEFEFKQVTFLNPSNIKIEWWERSEKDITNELIEDIQSDLNAKFDETQFDESFFLTQFALICLKEGWENLNYRGRGYLHYLCSLGFSDIINKLSSYIKLPNLKDSNKKTPIDIALCKHYYDCAYEVMKIANKGTFFNYKNEESLNDRVQKIQSHVRAWLKQKQFKNIKRAANTLQKNFRCLAARRSFQYQKRAAIIIQKSVRKWLVYNQKLEV
jgi:CG-1 domain/IQ calmodulin-binding motif